MTAGLDVSPI